MELGLYKLGYVEEGVANFWQIGSMDAIWLNVGKLAFACHKAMTLKRHGSEGDCKVLAIWLGSRSVQADVSTNHGRRKLKTLALGSLEASCGLEQPTCFILEIFCHTGVAKTCGIGLYHITSAASAAMLMAAGKCLLQCTSYPLEERSTQDRGIYSSRVSKIRSM